MRICETPMQILIKRHVTQYIMMWGNLGESNHSPANGSMCSTTCKWQKQKIISNDKQHEIYIVRFKQRNYKQSRHKSPLLSKLLL